MFFSSTMILNNTVLVCYIGYNFHYTTVLIYNICYNFTRVKFICSIEMLILSKLFA